MLAIFRKELNSFLGSLVAYSVIILFLVLTGLVLWVFPESNILDYGYAEMGSFFQLTPFILLFLVPAITMRSFAEEFKTGTIELLFTKPLKISSIIGGKLLAAWALVTIAILPTIIYYFIIKNIGNPIGNIDTASVVGSYFGLILLAGVFTAIGITISAITDNQIIAFLLSAFLCYFWYDGLHQIAGIFGGSSNYWLDYFSLQFHYNSLSKGVLDSRSIIFLSSVIGILVIITRSILNRLK